MFNDDFDFGYDFSEFGCKDFSEIDERNFDYIDDDVDEYYEIIERKIRFDEVFA